MKTLGILLPMGRRGAPRSNQQALTPGSKRWSAQSKAGWNCPKCTYYNFGFRATCFGCKTGRRPAGQPLQTLGAKKNLPSSITKPCEQLERQLAADKDPEVKALLQQAANLKKKQSATAAKELPLQDQRAKLTPQIKRLTTAVGKQQELLSNAQTKLQELRRELATAHVGLAHLPEEVLPAPKKIPMSLLEPSVVNLMKFVQLQSTKGNIEATALLQECVADIESSSAVEEPQLVLPDADAAMDVEEGVEPSAKKKKGMGAGTPLASPQAQEFLALGDAPGAASSTQGAEASDVL
eukprot:556737-Amphidinium_carterae.2